MLFRVRSQDERFETDIEARPTSFETEIANSLQ